MVVTYGHLKLAKYTRITFDAHQNTNMSFIKFFEKLELSPLFFFFRNHSWVSFVGFAESYTEVVRNMPSGFQRLPVELQQVVTKESGMNHKFIYLYVQVCMISNLTE